MSSVIPLTEAVLTWVTDGVAPGRRGAIAKRVCCHSLARGIKADMIGHAHRQGRAGLSRL